MLIVRNGGEANRGSCCRLRAARHPLSRVPIDRGNAAASSKLTFGNAGLLTGPLPIRELQTGLMSAISEFDAGRLSATGGAATHRSVLSKRRRRTRQAETQTADPTPAASPTTPWHDVTYAFLAGSLCVVGQSAAHSGLLANHPASAPVPADEEQRRLRGRLSRMGPLPCRDQSELPTTT